MTRQVDRPRVGISRCLLGDEVRYDGGHKLEPLIVSELGRAVEWVSVCPEVEIGMGVPREPIHLLRPLRDDGDVRLVGVRTGAEWTERMRAWSIGRIRELQALQLCGFVLKARSPSCGPRDVPIHDESGERAASGRGRFADMLAESCPGLPIEDEERLRHAAVRARFLADVLSFQASGPRAQAPG